jgi:hypothetical protein
MVQSTRVPWPRISSGLEMLPPTLMIAFGHPWLGAATLGGVLISSTLQSWILVRSEQEQQRAVLSYAQNTTSMGGDPTTVIAALRGRVSGTHDEPSAEGGEVGEPRQEYPHIRA